MSTVGLLLYIANKLWPSKLSVCFGITNVLNVGRKKRKKNVYFMEPCTWKKDITFTKIIFKFEKTIDDSSLGKCYVGSSHAEQEVVKVDVKPNPN